MGNCCGADAMSVHFPQRPRSGHRKSDDSMESVGGGTWAIPSTKARVAQDRLASRPAAAPLTSVGHQSTRDPLPNAPALTLQQLTTSTPIPVVNGLFGKKSPQLEPAWFISGTRPLVTAQVLGDTHTVSLLAPSMDNSQHVALADIVVVAAGPTPVVSALPSMPSVCDRPPSSLDGGARSASRSSRFGVMPFVYSDQHTLLDTHTDTAANSMFQDPPHEAFIPLQMPSHLWYGVM